VDGLRRFDRPTLILWGKVDTNFGPEIAERLASDIPGVVGVEYLEDSAHMPFQEEPDAYNAAVLRFLGASSDELALAWLERHRLFDSRSLGLWGIPVGLLVSTFVMYWFHRAEHRFDWLWRLTHRLHHSAPRVEMLGAYYTHPLEVLTKVLLGAVIRRR